jgi:hypothetical protein
MLKLIVFSKEERTLFSSLKKRKEKELSIRDKERGRERNGVIRP